MRTIQDIKILFVDDNVINQRIASFSIRKYGLICDFASNGEEAFKKYIENSYDLILMDLHMPVLSGFESAQKIRTFESQSESKHRAYIVALSASEVSERKSQCIECGMDDFMEKPLQSEKLIELLEGILSSPS